MSLIGELLIEGGAFVLEFVLHGIMELYGAVSKRLRGHDRDADSDEAAPSRTDNND